MESGQPGHLGQHVVQTASTTEDAPVMSHDQTTEVSTVQEMILTVRTAPMECVEEEVRYQDDQN